MKAGPWEGLLGRHGLGGQEVGWLSFKDKGIAEMHSQLRYMQSHQRSCQMLAGWDVRK